MATDLEVFTNALMTITGRALLGCANRQSAETRHARAANEASNQWQKANASRELAMMWASHPESVELLAEFGRLDEDQELSVVTNPRYFRYVKINQAILETLQALYITASTPEDMNLAVERVNDTMAFPGFRKSWKHMPRHLFRAEYISVVEAALSDGDA